jgi:hypothetical protein
MEYTGTSKSRATGCQRQQTAFALWNLWSKASAKCAHGLCWQGNALWPLRLDFGGGALAQNNIATAFEFSPSKTPILCSV